MVLAFFYIFKLGRPIRIGRPHLATCPRKLPPWAGMVLGLNSGTKLSPEYSKNNVLNSGDGLEVFFDAFADDMQ